MYYFAYGTNKDERAMARRAPKALVIGDAVLYGWEQEGLNIYLREGAQVEGLLWNITSECLASLDVYESYPTVYIRHWVTVETDNGNVKALVYRRKRK